MKSLALSAQSFLLEANTQLIELESIIKDIKPASLPVAGGERAAEESLNYIRAELHNVITAISNVTH